MTTCDEYVLIFRDEDEQSMVHAVTFCTQIWKAAGTVYSRGKGKPIVEEQQSREGSTPKDKEYSPMILKRKE